METIIKKAIEGGYPDERYGEEDTAVLDPLFWKALSKACGWAENMYTGKMVHDPQDGYGIPEENPRWLFEAKQFHEINLTHSWDAAVSYLAGIIEDKG